MKGRLNTSRRSISAYAPRRRDVAVQVEIGKQKLKPVSHLIGARVGRNLVLSSYASTAFELVQPRHDDALASLRRIRAASSSATSCLIAAL
jgi:hypothetical protein